MPSLTFDGGCFEPFVPSAANAWKPKRTIKITRLPMRTEERLTILFLLKDLASIFSAYENAGKRTNCQENPRQKSFVHFSSALRLRTSDAYRASQRFALWNWKGEPQCENPLDAV
jgi:hypothetical protein